MPGMRPSRMPIPVPRAIGIAESAHSCRVSIVESEPRRCGRRRPLVQVREDLADAVEAHDDRHEADAVEEVGDAEGEPGRALDEVRAGHREREAQEGAEEPGEEGAPESPTTSASPRTMRAKNSGGPKERATARERRRRDDQDERGHGAADERADRGDGQRGAGPALPRHLVPVDGGDGGGGLAGDAHEDGGDRAAVHGAVVDRRQHDDGAGRVELEGQRKEDRDAGDRADAGQRAHRRADDAADEGEETRFAGRSATPNPASRLQKASMPAPPAGAWRRYFLTLSRILPISSCSACTLTAASRICGARLVLDELADLLQLLDGGRVLHRLRERVLELPADGLRQVRRAHHGREVPRAEPVDLRAERHAHLLELGPARC